MRPRKSVPSNTVASTPACNPFSLSTILATSFPHFASRIYLPRSSISLELARLALSAPVLAATAACVSVTVGIFDSMTRYIDISITLIFLFHSLSRPDECRIVGVEQSDKRIYRREKSRNLSGVEDRTYVQNIKF